MEGWRSPSSGPPSSKCGRQMAFFKMNPPRSGPWPMGPMGSPLLSDCCCSNSLATATKNLLSMPRLTHFLPPGLMTFFQNEPPQIGAIPHEAKRKPPTPSESACPADVEWLSRHLEQPHRFSERYTVGAQAITAASPRQTDSGGAGGFRLASWAMAPIWGGLFRKKVIRDLSKLI